MWPRSSVNWPLAIDWIRDSQKMRRTFALLTGCVLVSASVNTVDAGWPEFKHQSHIDYARNNCWPQPFRGADANSVVAPFEVMRNNGWRDNNTLGTALFSQQQGLSEAGQLKIEWILTQAPQSHRVVYVKTGRSSEETARRIESVQIAISQMIPSGPLPQIMVTETEPSTSSGSYQTILHRAIVKTTPTPRLGTFTGVNAPAAQTVAPQTQNNGSSGK